MELMEKLQERAGRLTRSDFIQQYAGLYLLGKLPGSDALAFRTRIAGAQDALERMRRANEPASASHIFLRVEKSDRNTWLRRISVGRATNNDLVLRHESVSKLHAHFFVRLEGHAEVLALADAESANGTLVNGHTLVAGDEAAVVVSPGDRLCFGEVELDLLDAALVYERLRRRAVASGDF